MLRKIFSLGSLSIFQLAGGLLNALVLSCEGFKQCWRDFSCFTGCSELQHCQRDSERVCERITVFQNKRAASKLVL